MSLSLKDRAYEHIWDKVVSGHIPPGGRLSDIHLAKEIGISRTPVREAIILLETQGLVEQIAGLGPHVKSLDRGELDEAFEFREVLESAAAAKAAERITDSELAALNALCEQYRALARQVRDDGVRSVNHTLGDRLVVLDMAFHLKLIRAARNRRLLRGVTDLHILGRLLRRRAEIPTVSLLSRVALVYRDHRRIVRALRRRDADATRQWMSRHIQRARQYHLDAFDWHQRQEGLRGAGELDLPLHVQRLLARMETRQAAPETSGGADSAVAPTPTPQAPPPTRRRGRPGGHDPTEGAAGWPAVAARVTPGEPNS